jgi:hypothetical protein
LTEIKVADAVLLIRSTKAADERGTAVKKREQRLKRIGNSSGKGSFFSVEERLAQTIRVIGRARDRLVARAFAPLNT